MEINDKLRSHRAVMKLVSMEDALIDGLGEDADVDGHDIGPAR